MNANIADRLCRQIDEISAPPFDFATVKERTVRPEKPRTKRRVFLAAGLLCVALPALAVAAAHYAKIQVTNRFGTWQIYSPTVNVDWKPTNATLERIARRAPYHVIWPQGFPKDMRLRMTLSAASQLVLLQYRCGNRGVTFVTIIPKHAEAELQSWLSSQKMKNVNAAYQWTVGEERVSLQTNCLNAGQVAHIRASLENSAH